MPETPADRFPITASEIREGIAAAEERLRLLHRILIQFESAETEPQFEAVLQAQSPHQVSTSVTGVNLKKCIDEVRILHAERNRGRNGLATEVHAFLNLGDISVALSPEEEHLISEKLGRTTRSTSGVGVPKRIVWTLAHRGTRELSGLAPEQAPVSGA